MSANHDDEVLTFEEKLLAGRFKELLVNVRRKADAAPMGTTIDCIERLLLDEGRDLLRLTAETEIQHQADQAEKKGRAAARSAVSGGVAKGRKNGR